MVKIDETLITCRVCRTFVPARRRRSTAHVNVDAITVETLTTAITARKLDWGKTLVKVADVDEGVNQEEGIRLKGRVGMAVASQSVHVSQEVSDATNCVDV